MKRTKMYLSALIGFGGMLVLISAAQADPPGMAPGGGTPVTQPNAGQPQQLVRPTIAVFNMAAVMKEYGKAKYEVYKLSEERKKMSAELTGPRGEAVKLQQEIQLQQDPRTKEGMQKRQLELVRQIEDRSREIDKQLNEKASLIISSLYDEIKTVVDKTAEMNGYHIVFAYPDASSPEDAKNPYLKELKLKPPAAQPFYVARHVDITGVVIQTLNTWYPSPPVPVEAKQAQTQQQPPPQTPTPPPGQVVPGSGVTRP